MRRAPSGSKVGLVVGLLLLAGLYRGSNLTFPQQPAASVVVSVVPAILPLAAGPFQVSDSPSPPAQPAFQPPCADIPSDQVIGMAKIYVSTAINYVSQTYNFPPSELRLWDPPKGERYELLGVEIVWLWVSHPLSSGFGSTGITVVMDCQGKVLGEGTIKETLDKAEWAAYKTRYGSINPYLLKELRRKGDEDLLAVGISLQSPDADGKIRRRVAAKWGIEDLYFGFSFPPKYPRWANYEYEVELNEAGVETMRPLRDYLERSGYPVDFVKLPPIILATLPKRLILEAAQRPEVANISGPPGPFEARDPALPPPLRWTVWHREILGEVHLEFPIGVLRVPTAAG